MDWNNEAILLFQEAFVDLSNIGISLPFHVHFRTISQPLQHCVFVVEKHHLWQDLIYRLLSDLFLQIARHLNEIVVYCEDLAHRRLGSRHDQTGATTVRV